MTRSEIVLKLIGDARGCGLSGGVLNEFRWRLSHTSTQRLAQVVGSEEYGRRLWIRALEPDALPPVWLRRARQRSD